MAYIIALVMLGTCGLMALVLARTLGSLDQTQ